MAGFIVPGYPHPLQVPDANPSYQRIRDGFGAVRQRIEELEPDLLLLYSTQWLSVIGHQVQADPEPEWTHVDQEWHELGPIHYRFRMDQDFGASYVEHGRKRGLEMRTVDYEGFPIDTGSIVALKLLNPDDRFPASIVSCNMYADRSEIIVLGKAALDAVTAYRVPDGKGGTRAARVVAVAVTALSNRVHTGIVPFGEDRIHSLKDDEWNRKYLDILAHGRLEDAAQLARKFTAEANGDQKMKAVWWLNTLLGQTNALDGDVVAYGPLYGTGAAVVGLMPTQEEAGDLEFDEEDAEVYLGDRNVLGGANLFEAAEGVDLARSGEDLDAIRAKRLHIEKDVLAPHPGPEAPRGHVSGGTGNGDAAGRGVVTAKAAPKPVGAYPHARRVGDMLYLSGLGPRDPETNEVPGGPVWDEDGNRQEYDVRAQTEAVVRNMKLVLADAGATIDDVVDVTCYLIDMERDFAEFNEVYAKHFGDVQATRTTLEVNRLPTPIAVEFKVIATAPEVR